VHNREQCYLALAFSFFGFVGTVQSESVDRVESGKFSHVRQIANLRLKVHKCPGVAAVALSGEAGVAAFMRTSCWAGARSVIMAGPGMASKPATPRSRNSEASTASDGQLQTRKWQDQSGADRYTHDRDRASALPGRIAAARVAWRSRRSRQLPGGRGSRSPGFNRAATSERRQTLSGGGGGAGEIDDDIPF
jgi:hypothetical protein